MDTQHRAYALLLRVLRWSMLPGLIFALYLAYRWAEPAPTSSLPFQTSFNSTVTMRLEEAPFIGYANGRKSWSVWAKRIDLERLPGASFSTVQSATLVDIRDGALYTLPDTPAPPAASANASAAPSGTVNVKPAATFRARRGRYALQNLEPTPAHLTLNYNVQWQFKLTEDVDFRMQNGDRLQADSLTILELTNKRTGRPERRILCESGAKVTHKEVSMRANSARYDPAERLVECLGGVRGTFKNGTVQSERAFWSLNEQIVRCPETATGVVDGMAFRAEGLVIDMKHRTLRANRVRARFRMESRETFRLR